MCHWAGWEEEIREEGIGEAGDVVTEVLSHEVA